jgi:serine/threonine protein kinase
VTPNANPCPSAEELERLFSDDTTDSERSSVEVHVEACAACQERLGRLVAVTAAIPPPAAAGAAAHEPDEAFLNRLRNLLPADSPASTRPEVAAEEPAPSRLGPYEILGRLGRGGMGTVYKARHRELDKVVAVKVLSAHAASGQAVVRFRTEMKAVGRLDHANIVAAHDAGQAEGMYYLVMEFVEGLDLARLAARAGRLSVADACELAHQAAAGLRHAHDRGLTHRDVKPANLMLARGGVVKVLDLGLARMRGGADGATASGVLLGTADYIAPEQIGSAQHADGRADVYGLGATLYFLLAGSPPFAGDGTASWLEKLRAHQEEPVPPLRSRRADVPPALAALVESMLAKNPADRPASMAEVAEALTPFAAGADLPSLLARFGEALTDTAETTTTDLPGLGDYRPPRRRKSRRLYAALALAALVGVVVLVLVRRDPEPVRVLALEVRQVRGQGEETVPIGLLGTDRRTIEQGDGVRFSVKFSAPAYCYLVAFNPDGTEQLCYPEAATQDEARAAVPAKVAELRFPAGELNHFTLDQPGVQAFVLVASSRPLPAYAHWRERAGPAPWAKLNPIFDGGGLWRFDGTDWAELVERWELEPWSKAAAKMKLPDIFKKSGGGGKTEKRGKQPPKQRADLAEFFRTRPEFDAVHVLSFPVFRQP